MRLDKVREGSTRLEETWERPLSPEEGWRGWKRPEKG